ncbi:1-acyl-sn-glycerol-3-phosphate acyltransferase [Myxacorys almedinensis]|uniref:1-acyl-sn-glycerol-3-phosphate acyltransferase n=1 Tax=Myxacorys almedinensis A TaxID=2690445 RepID=A0A8J8CKU3_9CYAN|nr:1-acyl-sn-glycerol-3-phosphate acyltransferase [Myxacorys almedinensis]NDJ18951.1 1-acyl-sn-glycerol-3-phosphate acyltransferase [Myxacorys almedinensis A]
MPRSLQQVQPPLEFIPPALDRKAVYFLRSTLPLWLRFKTPIREVEAKNLEQLAHLYQQFQDGKIRLLLAFRHPSTDDPASMMYLMHHLLPRFAKQHGIRLQPPTHAHFMYDRGIPLWAGAIVGWMYSKLGGTPIHRGKLDRVGLRSARDLFANGQFPMMAAPEGATNGHNEIISPLEPGISQLGFWCAEDVQKAGRSEDVVIVPVGLQYRYATPPWDAIEKLLSELETDAGLNKSDIDESKGSEKHLYHRLYRLAAHLLVKMEEFYRRFYHQKIGTTENAKADTITNEEFAIRLQELLNTALQVPEDYFNVLAKGTVIDRCRRLEQAAWDCIYREDLQLDKLSPLERGLADLVAEEAQLRIWHMRIVESFVAVTGQYVVEKPTAERFTETVLIMWDTITRIKGGNAFHRPKLGKQTALITIGDPISLGGDRWAAYKKDRRSAKQAIADLTQDLQDAMEKMILNS